MCWAEVSRTLTLGGQTRCRLRSPSSLSMAKVIRRQTADGLIIPDFPALRLAKVAKSR
jgi:hypothetical protein